MSREERATGVMDSEYATKREGNLPLVYRYRVRARFAASGFRSLRPSISSPSVLDLGAADGKTLLALRDLFDGQGKYTGVELSDELLAAVPELPSNVRIRQGDVMDLPSSVTEESYDLCVCLAVLEHLPEPEDCVREAFRVLDEDGVFVASSPTPFWDHLAGRFGLVDDEFHQQDVTLDTLETWAYDAGFNRVQKLPFMWIGTAVLPYLGIEPSPDRSLQIDAKVRGLDPTNLTFVNQGFIAQKTEE